MQIGIGCRITESREGCRCSKSRIDLGNAGPLRIRLGTVVTQAEGLAVFLIGHVDVAVRAGHIDRIILPTAFDRQLDTARRRLNAEIPASHVEFRPDLNPVEVGDRVEHVNFISRPNGGLRKTHIAEIRHHEHGSHDATRANIDGIVDLVFQVRPFKLRRVGVVRAMIGDGLNRRAETIADVCGSLQAQLGIHTEHGGSAAAGTIGLNDVAAKIGFAGIAMHGP